MAEPVTREEALEKAWAKYPHQRAPMDDIVPAVARWAGFHAGFRDGWDALLSEIRPLVADLRTPSDLDSARRIIDEDEIRAHLKAIKRLRELVRELVKRYSAF